MIWSYCHPWSYAAKMANKIKDSLCVFTGGCHFSFTDSCQCSLQGITSLCVSHVISGHWDQIKTPVASWNYNSFPVGVNEWWKVNATKKPSKSNVKTPRRKQKLDLCRLTIHSAWMIDGLQNSHYKEVKRFLVCWVYFTKDSEIVMLIFGNQHCISQQWFPYWSFQSVRIWISLWVLAEWFKLSTSSWIRIKKRISFCPLCAQF